ncbi:hypothetical protein H2198_000342 [Neophaeococcomyces mojaviensis]|uniref:Uncharacterized protein n=1 Tax=Neophaeococcomyces mojaviensis TaxID=3383035 RepID=A0ACC3AKF7_9EURO|nr:hypothetical protein H2198_000342 [Knufia sp. JES_112]
MSTIILITGANSGVGLASTAVIASASAEYHVIMASRNPENGKKALAETQALDGIKGTLSTVQLDVTDQASIKNAVKVVEEQFGHLDVLVNNAGVVSQAPDLKTQFEDTFATNVLGPALVTQAFTPLLLKSKNPYSIYVSSGLGSLTMAADASRWDYNVEAPVYRATKAALNMWAVQESKMLEKQGVKTFAMCPGFVVSNLRGKDESARSGGGMAKDPRISGEVMLSIIDGRQDANVRKFVSTEGVYPW